MASERFRRAVSGWPASTTSEFETTKAHIKLTPLKGLILSGSAKNPDLSCWAYCRLAARSPGMLTFSAACIYLNIQQFASNAAHRRHSRSPQKQKHEGCLQSGKATPGSGVTGFSCTGTQVTLMEG